MTTDRNDSEAVVHGAMSSCSGSPLAIGFGRGRLAGRQLVSLLGCGAWRRLCYTLPPVISANQHRSVSGVKIDVAICVTRIPRIRHVVSLLDYSAAVSIVLIAISAGIWQIVGEDVAGPMPDTKGENDPA
ncbi:hypothetical protein [Mycobacterium sp. 1245805.9]|uniref:hypothetical protein n=1 Tax=Mycobacterium sp. 1245805.9 TaxID=1856862 RepID=UPI0012EAB5B7|nr:hypothetical protein [Mycobacterium sp. 1245805.9]